MMRSRKIRRATRNLQEEMRLTTCELFACLLFMSQKTISCSEGWRQSLNVNPDCISQLLSRKGKYHVTWKMWMNPLDFRPLIWVSETFYLHRDATLQFELQLDHVNLLAGAEFDQLCCSSLHLIYGYVHWLELHLFLPHHLNALLHIWKSVGSWRAKE